MEIGLTMNDNQLKYSNLKAEFYISLFYSDIDNPVAIKKGQFFQNFCNDCISVDTENNIVVLSRDGLYRQLPENIFFEEQSLSSQDKQHTIKSRSLAQQAYKQIIENFFLPFDTLFFREELLIEKRINYAEINARHILLRTLFDYDINSERNTLIQQLAFFRLSSSTIKGNLRLLSYIIKSILKEDTRIDIDYRTFDETLRIKQPVILITVLITHLSATQYLKKMEQYDDFFQKLAEWFLPFDCDYEYAIKDKSQVFTLGDNLILDYNTQLF